MPLDAIIVRGAREHNLKNIDVVIPRDKLVVITGVSGSGKSSLAFDTIYAEGQRRYVESLSAYARQFLGQMEKPDVDYIEGLSPAISIDQKGASRNPRSTVGTVTEIYDYLRLLFARVGHPHCPNCGREIARQTVQQIVDAVQQIPQGSRIMIMAPLIRDRKGEHQAVFEDLRKAGYVRVRVDGRIYDLSEEFPLDKNKKHTIEAVIDRLVVGESGSPTLWRLLLNWGLVWCWSLSSKVRNCSSRSISPVFTVASAWAKSPPGPSALIALTELAQPALDWGLRRRLPPTSS